MITIEPILHTILIRPFPPEGLSTGGIVVPESFQVRNNKAFVLAVGQGTPNKKMEYQPGDVVYNIKDSGEEVEISGERLFLIQASYVLAYERPSHV